MLAAIRRVSSFDRGFDDVRIGKFSVTGVRPHSGRLDFAQLFDPLGIQFGRPYFRASVHHCADWISAPSAVRLKRYREHLGA
jgi:hypothetical protein